MCAIVVVPCWEEGLIPFSEGIQELWEGESEGNHFSSSCVERGRMRVVSVCLLTVSSIHLVVLERRER